MTISFVIYAQISISTENILSIGKIHKCRHEIIIGTKYIMHDPSRTLNGLVSKVTKTMRHGQA